MRSYEVTSGCNAIADELKSVFFPDDVDALAILLNALIRLRRKCRRMDEDRFRGKRGETGIEMVEARIAQLKRDHLDAERLHGSAEFLNAAQSRADAIAGPDFGRICVP